MIDGLLEMLRQHADAVDGRDRKQLVDEAARLNYWRGWLDARADESAMRQEELVTLVEVVASAGCVALQVLGGRLARNEPWGEPGDVDERASNEATWQ